MLSSFVIATVGLLFASSAQAAANNLTQVTGVTPNPNNVGMYVYTPNKLTSPTPLIVAIHYCTGSAQAYFENTQYANLADIYGYIVIYPDAPRDGKCFDVNTNETLTHDGGGDSQGIASMVKYAIANYGVDQNQVYVTGTSSGAMMTNVMAGSYPDLFKAASAYSGVPFGCFAGPNAWNSDCSQGFISKTGQEWGDQVRAAYPGYTGPRPKMMLWHGTVDTALDYKNYPQEILEWTNVLGVSSTPSTTTLNDPEANYTHTTYGDPPQVHGYSAAGVGHTVPVHEYVDLDWFCIGSRDGWCVDALSTTSATTTPASTTWITSDWWITTSKPTTTTTSTTSTTSTSSTTTGDAPLASHWAQCAGLTYKGPTQCIAPYKCTYFNDWYSQCL